MQLHLQFDQHSIQFDPSVQQTYEHPLASIHFREIPHPLGHIWQLKIKPQQPLLLQQFRLTTTPSVASSEYFFCNGFQSWSESREFHRTEHIPNLRRIARPLFKYYGDYHFREIHRKPGFLHAWTYTYARLPEALLLFASLNEQQAFTLFQWDLATNSLQIERDLKGRKIDSTYTLLELLVVKGSSNTVFDAWAKALDMPALPKETVSGWTSWYNYYTKISEAKLQQNLRQLATFQPKADFFQMDDGFQQAVGDWLSIDSKKFPDGVHSIARQAHQSGFKAGIWLAPFICEPASDLYKQHPEWLLRDANGNAIRAGFAPHWSGFFYALDFYHPKFQAYLAEVLQTYTQKWNFQLLKLDFLYAVCLLGRADKTRAEILTDAIRFIRKYSGDARLLACGTPLGPLFGEVDYCRIGADIHLSWDHGLLKFFRKHERVSTYLALQSSLGRHHLNGRFFGNDPDVFILRKHKHRLTPNQQASILQINTISGSLIFHSDELETYDKTAKNWLQWFEQRKSSQLREVVPLKKDVYQLKIEQQGQTYQGWINLSRKEQVLEHGQLRLAPFECRIAFNES